MSESSTGLLEAPRDQAPEQEAETSSTDRRKLFMIVGGAAAVVVVALLAFLFLSGSGGEEETGLVTPAPRSEQPAAAPKAAAPGDKAPQPFDGDLGRDPFAPVFEPLPAEPDAATAAAGGAAVDPGTTTTGGAPTTGGTTTSGGTTGTGTPVTVKMIDVTADGANVTVDGAKYSAKVDGKTFATSFRLYGVFDERCAGLLFGDESVVMCEGDVRTLTP